MIDCICGCSEVNPIDIQPGAGQTVKFVDATIGGSIPPEYMSAVEKVREYETPESERERAAGSSLNHLI